MEDKVSKYLIKGEIILNHKLPVPYTGTSCDKKKKNMLVL